MNKQESNERLFAENPDVSYSDTAHIPLVTIGMPVFNGARYLEEAVTSLLEQTERDIVLLISDNYSSDETPRICARLAAEDHRIRYFRQSRNLGAIANFNFVLRQASSPFFAWAAHDDRWAPEFLAVTLDLLACHPEAVTAMTAVKQVDALGEVQAQLTLPVEMADCDPVVRARSVRNGGWHFVYGLHRREILTGIPLSNIFGSDTVLVFSMALRNPLVSSHATLWTQRIEGYEDVVSPGGRVVWKKALGPDGHLYTHNPLQQSRALIGSVLDSPLSVTGKARLSGHVVYAYWWNGIRNRALRDSEIRMRRATAERRYLVAALLAFRHAVLRPSRALLELKRLLRTH